MARSGTRPTIIDIAKRAGVSFKTVSRVLNGNPRVDPELSARVRHAMRELDYRPNAAARSLSGTHGYAIGLLYSKLLLEKIDDPDWYVPAFPAALESQALLACQEVGYHLVVEPVDFGAPTLAADLRRQLERLPVAGILVFPPACDNPVVLESLDARGLPYVRLAPGSDLERSATVATDEYGGALAMTRYLIGLGHRRIAFIAGPRDHLAANARERAYRDALAECGDAWPPRVEVGSFTFPGGMAAARALLGSAERPSAIFAANDDMAAGVIAAAHELGVRLPDELSVAGFDDSAIARYAWPQLTTVRQPITAMIRAAVRYLVDTIGGRQDLHDHLLLPFEIVTRGSAGPPRR
jgi:LacI family transcriptional regulator